MLLKHRQFQGLFALLGLSVIILITQCVVEYNPNISVNDNLLVVNGSIIRGNDHQTIVLTRSTSINSQVFNALENCNVFVTDDKNNIFWFEEESPGTYNAAIDSAYLKIGAKFKLSIETPGNQVYESDFEEIYDSPPIDSVYFINETVYSEEFMKDLNGIRLNVDVYANEENKEYYLYKIHEDWETRSSNTTIEKMLIGVKEEFITTYKYDSLNSEWVRDKAIPIPDFINFNDPDTFHICYLESAVDELYFSNTSNSSKMPFET